MSNLIKEFQSRVKNKKAVIAVVGLGYVGLPLAMEFAKAGFRVWGIEKDRDRLRRLKSGDSYISDVASRDLKKVMLSDNLKASGEFRALRECDVVIICVPTPLRRKYHPNISYVKEAVKGISRNIKKGALVVLESTTYPGTTEEVILPLLEKRNLKHNRDFYLSFSPERIDPGNKSYPLRRIPKIVGGISKEACAMTVAFYKSIIRTVVPVSSARTAEAVKLLENTFRLINIALIDEIAMMAHKMGIDVWEIIRGASTKPFGFMPFYPGPGVGGHCIPLDPHYLEWKAKELNFNTHFIALAGEVNRMMPEFVRMKSWRTLNALGVAPSHARILALGVAYKRDLDDSRESPALVILKMLSEDGASLVYHDSFVQEFTHEGLSMKSVALTEELIDSQDMVLILTDHTDVDYDWVVSHAKSVLDTRNACRGVTNHRERITLL